MIRTVIKNLKNKKANSTIPSVLFLVPRVFSQFKKYYTDISTNLHLSNYTTMSISHKTLAKFAFYADVIDCVFSTSVITFLTY